MLPTAVLVFLVILASTSGHSRAIGEEAAGLAISGGAREYVDVENEHLRLMIPVELLPPEEIQKFLLDSLTRSLLFVSNLFGYRANRKLLHIWDDTQLDPDGPVESGAWKGGWNLVIDMSGEVPSARKDVEWYALRMTHEYVHFVQGNVASSRSMPSAPIAEGFAELISSYAAACYGDRIMDTYADAGCECRHECVSDERGMQSGKWVRPLHIIAASALRAGQMPPIRNLLIAQYGPYSGWSNPLGVLLLYRLPASLLGFVDDRFGRETLVELFRTAPSVPVTRMGGQADPGDLYNWFEHCTGVLIDQLEAEWHTFLASVEIEERHIYAIRLLKETEKIGMDSLLTHLRRNGQKLAPGFRKAFVELLDDIYRYALEFGMPDWRGEGLCCGAFAGLTEGLLQARIARMAEWADELESSTYEP
jgi:hypothetical protein